MTMPMTILIADDDPTDSGAAAQLVDRAAGAIGCTARIVVAATAVQALSTVQRGVRPDLVIVDYMLPGSGVTVARLMQTQTPPIPCVAWSFVGMLPRSDRALFVDVWDKAGDPADLAATAAQLLLRIRQLRDG